jgi:hypothetical protein
MHLINFKAQIIHVPKWTLTYKNQSPAILLELRVKNFH